MANVAVTRVIVEYVCDRKKFRLEFDPATVGSIVLSQPDLKRQQFGQKEGVPAEGIPGMAVATQKLDATLPLIQQLSSKNAGILSELAPATVSEDPPGPPLWWHTTLCSWFHPE